MPTLVFPSQEALQLALTSGLVPAEVQAAPARGHRTPEGALLVTPETPFARPKVKALTELGIRLEKEEPEKGTAVSCWAELLPLRRTPSLDVPGGPILFLPADERELLPLAGELLRLGCDRQELCLAESTSGRRALLRAAAPPYFTLTRAIDRLGGLRAFVPVIAGQHAVWMELGHTHPLARTLRASPGTLWLLPGEGRWMTAPDGPWLDLYQLVDLQLPQPAEDWEPRPPPGRLQVPLRLAQAARVEPASLWVLRENAVAQVESLVHTLPEALLAQLRFAVSGPPEAPCVVLRARPGREKPPELGLAGTAYAPLPQLPNLYLPCDALLEPPLRRDRLRALLTPDTDTVTWLHPTSQGAFRAERLPEHAFQPLDEWVEYLIDTGAAALQPWVRGATFDFEAFAATGTEPREAPPPLQRGGFRAPCLPALPPARPRARHPRPATPSGSRGERAPAPPHPAHSPHARADERRRAGAHRAGEGLPRAGVSGGCARAPGLVGADGGAEQPARAQARREPVLDTCPLAGLGRRGGGARHPLGGGRVPWHAALRADCHRRALGR